MNLSLKGYTKKKQFDRPDKELPPQHQKILKNTQGIDKNPKKYKIKKKRNSMNKYQKPTALR